MRALIHDPAAPSGLRLGEVPEPVPVAGQALIEVHAVSLNFAEAAYAADRTPAGTVMGLDAAGVVLEPAADGSGPPPGARVVSFGWAAGGWAERRAADTGHLAVVPDSVDLGTASTLPAAGVSALRAVRDLGPVLGRRVLVTGASGGVGRFAVQLAALAGAHVIASVGSRARGEGLRELGAAEVVIGPGQVGAPVFGVLDNVGGPQLAEAFGLLEDGGVLQSVGKASLEPTTFDFEEERRKGGRKRLEVFMVGNPVYGPTFGPDLGRLVRLLEAGALTPRIGWRGPWHRAPEAVEALLSRRVLGKAVLDVPGEG
ncbi:zinc-binding dehydrogenase [Streptomyces sp. IBSBF 2435]|uniref:zinc-binding dehydrogenase n=1 Tax=Streptomyces sp. IBSBF 2435 TaxID=2903531 RepID=UPI002FDC70F4